MSEIASKWFSVVLLGEDLDPNTVTDVLEVVPTDKYEKGYQREYKGKLSKPRAVGMWCYRREITDPFHKDLENFLNIFKKTNFPEISGVERASLHMYLGLSNDDSKLEDSFEFILHPNVISKLKDMGLDVRVTIN